MTRESKSIYQTDGLNFTISSICSLPPFHFDVVIHLETKSTESLVLIPGSVYKNRELLLSSGSIYLGCVIIFLLEVRRIVGRNSWAYYMTNCRSLEPVCSEQCSVESEA